MRSDRIDSMRVRKIQLKDFKRFDDLTIDLGDTPAKVVALVGPNGCGKSSVFDAFEEVSRGLRGGPGEQPDFYLKSMYHPRESLRTTNYRTAQGVEVEREDGTRNFDKKSFYVRSAYSFTSKLNVQSITAQPDIADDPNRPGSTIAIDGRLRENHERLLGMMYEEFDRGQLTGDMVRDKLTSTLNEVLGAVLDLRVASLGNVTQKKGQLYFSKNDATAFPYQNLSAGEKEVVDLVVDLVVKTPEFTDTVFCIDEPELHLNSSIQRRLLIELEKLIPDSGQLWIATHSVGFLRALQEELSGNCAVLDFSARDYFVGEHVIRPIELSRPNWQRIFATALDDLVGLLAPRVIVYCEGRKDLGANGEELGLDARVYNQVFATTHPDVLFISSGGGTEPKINSGVALEVLSKAFLDVELYVLKDRDELTDDQLASFLSSSKGHRMLGRRELENYLFDEDVLSHYCASTGVQFDVQAYGQLVTAIDTQDLKHIQQKLKHLLGFEGTVADFKFELSKFIVPEMSVHQALRSHIFGG